MRIRNNKKSLIVNKEYSRLPYWTDEGYEDVQQSVSQKYVQDTYGAFAESENQPPYLSDADYQGLEYQYQNPEFFDSTKLPDIDFKNTIPKGTCYELWVSMFGSGTGAFIPTASEWNKLNEYTKKCPLIYMPHICCLNMKINGPDKVQPGETVEYSVSGGGHGCAYDIDAKRGEFIGYKYTAPSTPGSDRLTIQPWMSDDQHTICAKKDILIEGGCKGKIYALITTMAVGASQTLSVTGGSEYDDYYWTASTGSLSSNEGMSVVYTAPATNPNCANNPTITLTCGGVQVDSVSISVNARGGYGVGYKCTVTQPATCTVSYYPGNPYPYRINYYATVGGVKLSLHCDGSETIGTSENIAPAIAWETGSCAVAEQAALDRLGGWTYLECQAPFETWFDNRSELDKLLGCCPAQLM